MSVASFDSAYYRSANYIDYLERSDRYRQTAREVTDLLRKLCRIDRSSRILDYGCAVGLLMDGLRDEGFTNVFGVDVSPFARDEAAKRGHAVFAPGEHEEKVELLIALDVFEHMTDGAVRHAIDAYTPGSMLVRVPSSVDGKTFHLAVSRRDPTHINCKTKDAWCVFFREIGYEPILLDLHTVYDTPGVTCLLALRVVAP